MTVATYRELIAWQRAMDLAAEIYKATESFPKGEEYGLKVQLRRAAVSVPSNIAEGQGRQTTGEFVQFLGHARGSLLEIETQVLLSERLQFFDNMTTERLLQSSTSTAKVLNGLISSLAGRRKRGH